MITFVHFLFFNVALTQQVTAVDYLKKSGEAMNEATHLYSAYSIKQFDAEGNILKQEEAEIAINISKSEYYSKYGNDYVIDNKNERILINEHTKQIIISEQLHKTKKPASVSMDYSALDSLIARKEISLTIETETDDMVRIKMEYKTPGLIEKIRIDLDKKTFFVKRLENHYRKNKNTRAIREEYIFHTMETKPELKKDFFSLKNYAVKAGGKLIATSAFSQYTVIDQRK